MAEAAVRPKEANKHAVKGSRVIKSSGKDDDIKANGKRGRPRVEGQDESAVERRRTQIRLAQRAYRERKETTISKLEQRVQQLQSSLDQAQSLVVSFKDKASMAGLTACNPAVALELEEMALQVLQLNRRKGSEAAESTLNAPKTPLVDESTTKIPTQPVFSTGAEQSEWLPQTTVPEHEMTAPMGYSVIYDDDQGMEDSTDALAAIPLPSTSQALQRFPHHMPQLEVMDRWFPSIPLNPKPIYTYNFQETSFARRLTRDCYEKSYHLLTNPHSSPDIIHKTLRYSLCFGSVKSIAERIKSKLMGSKYESLETWDLPVVNVAGAGLHFPREGRDGGKPFDDTRTRNTGPFQISRAEHQPNAEYFPYEIAQWVGLEGTWFDAYDVEAFLLQQGLQLDGSSPIATMEIDDSSTPELERNISSPDSFSTTSFSGPHSPMSDEAQVEFFAPNVEQVLNEFSTEALGFDTDMSLSGTGPEIMGKTVGDGIPPATFVQPQPMPQSQKAKRTVVIDVDQLITALNRESICLGRSPGYNKANVERALKRIVSEAY